MNLLSETRIRFDNTPSFSQKHMKCSMRKTVLLLFQVSPCSWWGHNAGVHDSMPSEFEAQKDSTPSFLQLYRQIHSTGVFVQSLLAVICDKSCQRCGLASD